MAYTNVFSNVITSMTGGRRSDLGRITKYGLFVSGINASHHALKNYSPISDNYNRLFIIRSPKFVQKYFAGGTGDIYSPDSLWVQVKHMMEYMLVSLTGFADKTLAKASTPVQGGYAGRSFAVPTVVQDTTDTVSLTLYEMQGSPITQVLDVWANGIGDQYSGLAHYGGYVSGGTGANGLPTRLYKLNDYEDDVAYDYNEANHTMEAIWVQTDKTGSQVERAWFLADMFPTGIPQQGVANLEDAANHNTIRIDVPFNVVVYQSAPITSVANDLLKKYMLVSNSVNYVPEVGDAVYAANDVGLFNRQLGEIPFDSAVGTNIGNVPVYNQHITAYTRQAEHKNMDDAKLAGQPGRLDPPEFDKWQGFAQN